MGLVIKYYLNHKEGAFRDPKTAREFGNSSNKIKNYQFQWLAKYKFKKYENKPNN